MVEDGEQPGEEFQPGEQAGRDGQAGQEAGEPAQAAPPRRRRRAASRPAGPPAQEVEGDQAQLLNTDAPQGEPSEDDAMAADVTGVEEQETADVGAEGAEAASGGESAAGLTSKTTTSGSQPKRPRRATRGVTTVAFSAVPQPEAPATVPAAEVPAVALFQPPVESKPARRTRKPRSSAAQDSDAAQGQESAEDTSTSGQQAPKSGTKSGGRAKSRTQSKAKSQPAAGADGADEGREPGEGREQDEASVTASQTGAREVDPDQTNAHQPETGTIDADQTDSDQTDADQTDSDQTDADQTDSDQTDPDQTDSDQTDSGEADDRSADDAPRRRRRRGGRRRRRPGTAQGEDSDSADDEAEASVKDTSATSGETEPTDTSSKSGGPGAEDGSEGEDSSESTSARRRRRRRRRAGVAEEMEDLSAEDPPNTVVKVREARRPKDEITSVRGSTRIEAKKQRRRDGREAGRRRPPILTEAEFLARREAVSRVMCVREHGDRTQVAVLEDGILVEHYVNRAESSSLVGNVYVGKVQNVLPSMEAAFVDIGRGRNAVLYAGEVNWEAAGLEGQPKRIELAMKSGDPVLVQVTKDPIGHKGARLTSQISLPGRFLVYVPEGSMTGISRKLPDTERGRLKGILKGVVPDGAGVIVRTAAEGASEEQLTADVTRLAEQWADIKKKAKSASPPSLLYGEPDLAIKVVRDIFNEDFTELLVQGESTWATLSEYIGWVAPDLLSKATKWVENDDLYAANRIDEQLAKALDRKVWLPSGGSLVIDRTEAMTVVDVNTGKFTGQGGNLEETVTSNNLEAAEEIVRQLRLRDIGGIIVVDFIDMVLESNRDLVLRRLVECLGRDRTKHQVAEVTSLGLVQMTRKRIGQGLLEVFSTPCEHCGGRGHMVSAEPVSLEQQGEDTDNRRDRGARRGRKKAAPAVLGGKQTGRTPPPPVFDEEGHPHHDEHMAAADEPSDGAPSVADSGREEQLSAVGSASSADVSADEPETLEPPTSSESPEQSWDDVPEEGSDDNAEQASDGGPADRDPAESAGDAHGPAAPQDETVAEPGDEPGDQPREAAPGEDGDGASHEDAV